MHAGGGHAGVQAVLRRQQPGGFTLLETMIAVAVSAILASIGYPSFAEQVRKARRSDAIVRLVQLQHAQERWRANNVAYAALGDLGVAASSADSHYRLAVADVRAAGYVATAEALGAQARDANCRFLRLVVDGANTAFDSGPDAASSNPPALNERCWLR